MTSKSITERIESKRADSRDGTRECREDCAMLERRRREVPGGTLLLFLLLFDFYSFPVRVERREVGRGDFPCSVLGAPYSAIPFDSLSFSS
ncbi:hypothetical protein HN011_008299 [Eciton burchellii]|jgi:hypothetical protein|nr:hypothetical protein HN011_008299 [Eciton burchellii]